jgi:hypothetical protein
MSVTVSPAPCATALATVDDPAGSPTVRRSVIAPVRRGGRFVAKLASDVGQGTVEYVGLLLLMATVLAAVVAAAGQLGGEDEIGKKVVTQIGKSIDKAGGEQR